jgi:hypothetical protein
VSVHRLAIYSITPLEFDIRQRPPVYILVWLVGRLEVGDYRLLPSLQTYLSLNTVLLEVINVNTDRYRTPYPYHSPFNLYKPSINPTTPSIPSTTYCEPITCLYGSLHTSSTRYKHSLICYKPLLPVISPFWPVTPFINTIWQM